MTVQHHVTATAGETRASTRRRTTGARLLSIGGILGGLAVGSCCVVPFVLVTVGVSGAWIGNLTALTPYKPIFVAFTVAVLAVGFFMVYRRPKVACADGSYCASPASDRIAKIGLWVATVLVVIALGFPKLAPLFL